MNEILNFVEMLFIKARNHSADFNMEIRVFLFAELLNIISVEYWGSYF